MASFQFFQGTEITIKLFRQDPKVALVCHDSSPDVKFKIVGISTLMMYGVLSNQVSLIID